MTILSSNEVAVREGGALAVQAGQTKWSDQQLAVLRSVGIEEDVTEAELDAFLHECQQRKLDPFSKQIYLIGRYDSRAQRKVYRSQTGIDGFRVIAHRAADEARRDLSYEDTMWCGYDGEWHDVWLFNDPPAAAKVVVLSNGQRYPGVATLGEYAALYPSGDPMPMWKRMPSTMLAKCAEALALRKAFPDDLSGIYTAEEMAQADNPVGVAPQPQERKAERASRTGPAVDEWTRPAPEQAAAPVVEVEEAELVNEPTPDPATEPATEPMVTPAQARMMHAIFNKSQVRSRDRRLEIVSGIVGRELGSSSELTVGEASKVIDALNNGALDTPTVAPADEGIDVMQALEQLIADANDEDGFELARADIEREHASGGIGGDQLAALQARWIDCRNAAMSGASS